ncbi:hypothetical protein NDI45_16295 [Leptolyngbya sp. GB1-A1]|uniref:hypothetical protein n=1 Tax=Leptolyngbya sp. GB1-A1 TaxID=2933908 RepID=UPI003299A00C
MDAKFQPVPRPNSNQNSLGIDEWKLLEELCEGDSMQLELMTKLLDTERQYQLASNRSGILKDLKRVFDTSSRDKETAIQAAHRDRDLKQAVEAGNVEAVKQALRRAVPECLKLPVTGLQ